MASEPGNQAAPSGTFNKLKSALGLQPTPKPLSQGLGPINTHPALSRQDSFPEICSTPSDVGIFEVAHNKCRDADGKFSWKKFFSKHPVVLQRRAGQQGGCGGITKRRTVEFVECLAAD